MAKINCNECGDLGYTVIFKNGAFTGYLFCTHCNPTGERQMLVMRPEKPEVINVTSKGLSIWEVAEIRGRYTSPSNEVRTCDFDKIAMARDIAVLCSEIMRLRKQLDLDV